MIGINKFTARLCKVLTLNLELLDSTITLIEYQTNFIFSILFSKFKILVCLDFFLTISDMKFFFY